jgi:hypothetical protein
LLKQLCVGAASADKRNEYNLWRGLIVARDQLQARRRRPAAWPPSRIGFRKVKKPHAALACSLNGNQKPQFFDDGLALGANTP